RQTRKTVYVGRDERVASLAVEAGGRYAIISTASSAQPAARRTSIPYWITDSGYTEPREFRTNVGDAQGGGGRMGIVSLETGDVRWLDAAGALRAGQPDSVPPLGSTRFLQWNQDGTMG